MMELAKKTGGKCPFSFGKPPEKAQTPTNKKDCPFSFGLDKDADSEDEADVPTGHSKNSSCPLFDHETKHDGDDNSESVEIGDSKKKGNLVDDCPELRIGKTVAGKYRLIFS